MRAQQGAVFGAMVVVVAALATLIVTPSASGGNGGPTRPVDTDINTYVLFGFTSVEFKGGNLEGRGIINGGNVGANGTDPGDPDPTVSICANGRAVMSDGTQVVGDTVRLSPECFFWDLFANRTVGEGGATLHSGPTAVGIPAVTVPSEPSVECDENNPVTVHDDGDGGDPDPFVLPPGQYGAVSFQNGTTVQLSDGLYEMCSFHTGQHVTVTVGDTTDIRVTGDLHFNDDTSFGMNNPCATTIFVRGDGVTSNDATINFGENDVVGGHFLTLEGRINFGRSVDLFGTFWGDEISSDFNGNVSFCETSSEPELGEFTVEKSIAGPGAGQQGQIVFEISCLPSPPNGVIADWVIPAGQAAGTVSTVVTDVTLPATCTATETVNGDNATIDVTQGTPVTDEDSSTHSNFVDTTTTTGGPAIEGEVIPDEPVDTEPQTLPATGGGARGLAIGLLCTTLGALLLVAAHQRRTAVLARSSANHFRR